jgi:beta-glucosidase
MSNTITGMQSTKVIACAKHFIGNEQEKNRQSMSANIPDRAMHELYLWPFADAVKANVGSVMCSYNQVNGSFACENSQIINNLLKGELDFQGFVVSGKMQIRFLQSVL